MSVTCLAFLHLLEIEQWTKSAKFFLVYCKIYGFCLTAEDICLISADSADVCGWSISSGLSLMCSVLKTLCYHMREIFFQNIPSSSKSETSPISIYKIWSFYHGMHFPLSLDSFMKSWNLHEDFLIHNYLMIYSSNLIELNLSCLALSRNIM
jgi:hypothetical protein